MFITRTITAQRSLPPAPEVTHVRQSPPCHRRLTRHRPRLRPARRPKWLGCGVNYREDVKAADAVVEAIAKGGGRSVALKGDIAVEADVLGMFDAATKALRPLSAVIANAGIVAPTAKLAEMSIERMRRVSEVNVLGAYLTAREATRRMSKSLGGAGGSIVMMSSAAARLGSPNLYVDYAGSKGAIDTLTLGLAQGTRRRGRQGQRYPPWAHRHRYSRQRRRAGPSKDSGRHCPNGAPRHG
jgi:NAD(P)-dependent dehydrogenase (short-subunit alcohol dehydrogenase family)